MKKVEIICSQKGKLSDVLQKQDLKYNVIFKALRNKDIKVNGKRIKENLLVNKGDKIEIYFEENIQKEIEIIYQDENIIVANKPRNIEIEGQDGLCELLNASAVHRLDRNTTGLVILAKNNVSKQALMEVFKNRWITKKYLALVAGRCNFAGEIKKAYLLKDSETSKVKIYDNFVKGSKEIESKFKTLKSNENFSVVECELLTGRTHQLRAHLAYLGYPIIGDGKYGKNEINKKFNEKYQKLHCFYIKINKIDANLKYLEGKEFLKYPDFYS